MISQDWLVKAEVLGLFSREDPISDYRSFVEGDSPSFIEDLVIEDLDEG